MDDRVKELRKITNNEPLLFPLIDQVAEIESRLAQVGKLPFYKVNPNNPEQQKMLPAFKIYKELLQQYTNCIKTLAHSAGIDESDEESPLRKWVAARAGSK